MEKNKDVQNKEQLIQKTGERRRKAALELFLLLLTSI